MNPSAPFIHQLPAVLCLLLAAVTAAAQVHPGRELVRLDPKNHVHDIDINTNVATTITFPEKISLLTGFGLVTDPGKMNQMATSKVATVHYESVAGDTLVVRLIKPGEPCHATVRTTRSMYLLRFNAADEANLAVLVSPPMQTSAAVEVSPQKVVDNRIQFSAEELVGMLSKARNRKALQPLNPGLFSGWDERNGLEMTSTQNDMVTSIYEIQRNPAKDLTVFRSWITNKGTKPFEFEPMGTKIRVGGRSYDAQLVDCANTIEPGQRQALDLILQGGPGGTREGLSIHQDFRIELPEPGRAPMLLPPIAGDAAFDGK
ncbi:MAG: hypothetical protein IAE77_08695 [Prosthecobacter sp.]|jgi:hypothetical protein|uniref:hypothetical protein n=1 Tax=Prosthecobacter sp. TaxID=1965333 RepID=UPI0019E8CA7B|nr:hypothetical protein [Prosthecobacter sp.]MBE2283528.1 hypothetical protein [Prosthecobacter sp.]